MLYIFWTLGMLAFKLAIFDQCQCILLCVRVLLAKDTPFSTTSETLSYPHLKFTEEIPRRKRNYPKQWTLSFSALCHWKRDLEGSSFLNPHIYLQNQTNKQSNRRKLKSARILRHNQLAKCKTSFPWILMSSRGHLSNYVFSFLWQKYWCPTVLASPSLELDLTYL